MTGSASAAHASKGHTSSHTSSNTSRYTTAKSHIATTAATMTNTTNSLVPLGEVRDIVQRLFAQHLDGSWTFRYDHARRRAGSCNYVTRTITLSKFIRRTTRENIEQTLLHEIAHALAGPGSGHGPRWKRIAQEIGYVGGRTTDFSMVADHEAPWIGYCPNGHRFVRFRRPNGKASCTTCHKGYSDAYVIRWESQR